MSPHQLAFGQRKLERRAVDEVLPNELAIQKYCANGIEICLYNL